MVKTGIKVFYGHKYTHPTHIPTNKHVNTYMQEF